MKSSRQGLAKLFFISILIFSYTADCKDPWRSDWTKFRASQYRLLPAVMLANAAMWRVGPSSHANWTGPVLLDEQVRNSLVFKTKNQRAFAAKLSDTLLYGLIGYPFIVNIGAELYVSGGHHETALQAGLIAAQSFMFASFAYLVVSRTLSRERPFQRSCAGDSHYSEDCDDFDSRLSFFSGHTTMAFTAAGLICTHQYKMNLWGESLPCYLAAGAASVVGLARVSSDKHHFSDVLIGAAVGFSMGWYVPKYLHYSDNSSDLEFSILPWLQTTGSGVWAHVSY